MLANHVSKTLLIFFLTTGYLSLPAQDIIPRFENLSVNDGLPHSSVYSILQDKKGFMWFGTPDGLCRYDGSVLTSYKYKPLNENEPTNNFVRGKLAEDKKGNIWYSNETGIYKWDVLTEKIVIAFPFLKEHYKNSQFSTIDLDEMGNLWMLNLPFGLTRFNIESRQVKIFALPLYKRWTSVQYAFYTADDDNIWLRVVTNNEPFFKFNKKKEVFTAEFAGNPPHAIFFDKKKKVLAYEDKLIIQYKNKTEPVSIPKIINGKKVSYFSFNGLMDSHQRIWMTARGNGLFYYNENDGSFHEYHHDNSKIKSLPFDLTICLFIDRSDNLWIGIDGGGVARIDLKQPKFNLFPLSEGDYPVLNDYFTKCFYEDNKKRIWFGSHNNGFSIYNPVTSELKNYRNIPSKPTSLPANSVAGFYKDKRGNMWIGTNSGISIFNEKTSSFTTLPIRNLPPLHRYVNLFVFKFIELKNGDLLVATLLGLVRISFTKAGQPAGIYYGNKPFLQSTTTDVVEMDDNSILVALPALGLYHLQPTKTGFDSIKTYFNGVDLRCIRRDEQHKNMVWIGSGKGLIQFDIATQKFKIWDEKDGLANSYVYGCLEDEKHNLWISSNGGLSYLDRSTNRIDNYTFQDGLQSNEFNTQAFYKSTTNTFYFGGIKGFNWFQSKKFTSDPYKPQAAITQIEVDNIPFAADSALLLHSYIHLPYNKNDLNFKFAALDYTRPEANRIQYKLQGWDANWTTAYERSARYSNLPPGKYTMIVKASNAAGLWSNEETLTIIIHRPFWQQVWFHALLIVVLVLIIILATYTYAQQRVKQKMHMLEKQAAINAERNRISKDMHDEIGNGLTHIALLSELMQLQHETAPAVKKDIKAISTSAGKLVQTMSEIIWSMSPQNDTLDNLLAYIREQSQLYFESLNVVYTIEFPDVLPHIKLTNEERRNVFLVTKEALANAMKHAHATHIHLSMVITDTVYCFNVTDDGIGMAAHKIRVSSNGLKNMRKRMDDIGGTIEWIPGKQGTRVEYCLIRQ